MEWMPIEREAWFGSCIFLSSQQFILVIDIAVMSMVCPLLQVVGMGLAALRVVLF